MQGCDRLPCKLSAAAVGRLSAQIDDCIAGIILQTAVFVIQSKGFPGQVEGYFRFLTGSQMQLSDPLKLGVGGALPADLDISLNSLAACP